MHRDDEFASVLGDEGSKHSLPCVGRRSLLGWAREHKVPFLACDAATRTAKFSTSCGRNITLGRSSRCRPLDILEHLV